MPQKSRPKNKPVSAFSNPQLIRPPEMARTLGISYQRMINIFYEYHLPVVFSYGRYYMTRAVFRRIVKNQRDLLSVIEKRYCKMFAEGYSLAFIKQQARIDFEIENIWILPTRRAAAFVTEAIYKMEMEEFARLKQSRMLSGNEEAKHV